MTQDLFRIIFKIDQTDWHGYSTESLWARPLDGSSDPTAFQLLNSPFYVKGVSYLDIVRAILQDGQYTFASVVSPGGHSTYRLLVEGERSEPFRVWWKKLNDIGCTFESGEFQGKKLYSVDVPANADIYRVYSILQDGEKLEVWMFEEGHVGHLLKGEQQGSKPNS